MAVFALFLYGRISLGGFATSGDVASTSVTLLIIGGLVSINIKIALIIQEKEMGDCAPPRRLKCGTDVSPEGRIFHSHRETRFGDCSIYTVEEDSPHAEPPFPTGISAPTSPVGITTPTSPTCPASATGGRAFVEASMRRGRGLAVLLFV